MPGRVRRRRRLTKAERQRALELSGRWVKGRVFDRVLVVSPHDDRTFETCNFSMGVEWPDAPVKTKFINCTLKQASMPRKVPVTYSRDQFVCCKFDHHDWTQQEKQDARDSLA